MVAYFAIVKQNRADPDEGARADAAPVNHGAVPDTHVVADIQRRAGRCMHDRAVLNVDPVTDSNRSDSFLRITLI